jgi:hypothetical protein
MFFLLPPTQYKWLFHKINLYPLGIKSRVGQHVSKANLAAGWNLTKQLQIWCMWERGKVAPDLQNQSNHKLSYPKKLFQVRQNTTSA